MALESFPMKPFTTIQKILKCTWLIRMAEGIGTKSEKENSNGCLRKHKDIIYERKETIDNILMDIENILDNTEIGYETRVLKSKEITQLPFTCTLQRSAFLGSNLCS